MAEVDGDAPAFVWTSAEPLADGETEQPTAAFVKTAGRWGDFHWRVIDGDM